MRISSIYTAISPFVIRSAKTEFIRAWKVAGLFVIPKYITLGSKSPLFVDIAPFHSSPSQIQIL